MDVIFIKNTFIIKDAYFEIEKQVLMAKNREKWNKVVYIQGEKAKIKSNLKNQKQI